MIEATKITRWSAIAFSDRPAYAIDSLTEYVRCLGQGGFNLRFRAHAELPVRAVDDAEGA